MFKKVYIYLVLFATLMMSIGGTVGAFMAVADLVAPPSYYQSFEEYKVMRGIDKGGGSSQPVSVEQLKQEYDSYIQMEQRRTKDRAMNTLIKSLGWVVIPLPVFFYFQRQSRKDT